MLAWLSSFRLLAMASPHWMLIGSYGYDRTLVYALKPSVKNSGTQSGASTCTT